MKSDAQHATRLVLTTDEGLGRISVGMEPFFDFSFWMAEELEDLVARWKPYAAPRDSRQTTRVREAE